MKRKGILGLLMCLIAVLSWGGRNSIMIGISVTVITEIVGLVVGLVSGYFGGAIDSVIMRIVDFIQILPQMPIRVKIPKIKIKAVKVV